MGFSTTSGRCLAVWFSVCVLAACGGGGGGGGGGTTSPPPPPSNSAPSFSSATEFSFPENQPVRFTVSVTDPDGDTVTITEAGTGDGGLFQLNASTGEVTALTPNGAFNFESPQDSDSDNAYVQSFNLSDGTVTVTETVTVTITNVEEPPQYLGSTDFTGPEISTVGFAISATDNDSSVLEYALSGADAAAFSIEGNSSLNFVDPPDFENPADANGDNVYDVTLSITNADATITVDLTATVTNVDEVPVCDGAETFAFAENETGVVYTFRASDPEGDAFTYEALQVIAENVLVDNLSLDPVTGAVTLAAAIDFEALVNPSGELRATVGESTCSATFTVTDVTGVATSGIKVLATAIAVSAVGDVDADGTQDLWFTTAGSGDQGGILVFGSYLATGMPAATLDLSSASAAEAIRIQISETVILGGAEQVLVAREVGDIDGDGSDELLVGFETCAGCAEPRAMAYLIWGSTLQTNTSGNLVIDQLAANEVLVIPFEGQVSTQVGFASGDYDGDDRADIAFGLPTPVEQSFVIFGDFLAAAKASGAVDLAGAAQSQALDLNINYLTFPDAGRRMSNVNDIDGDGRRELVFATAQWVNVVYSSTIDSGRTAGLLNLGDVFDIQVNAIFGVPAFNHQPFDLEGDGIPDIPWASPAGELANVAIGATFATTPNAKFVDDTVNPVTALDVTGLDDVSSDGFAELALALRTSIAPDVNEVQVVNGATLDGVALGFALDLGTSAPGEAVRIGGITAADSLAGSVTSVADLDGDGRRELVVLDAARGEIYVVRGLDIGSALMTGDAALDMNALFNSE